MEERLRAFYAVYDPSKLANIAAIKAKYGQRERELFRFLHQKCVLLLKSPDCSLARTHTHQRTCFEHPQSTRV